MMDILAGMDARDDMQAEGEEILSMDAMAFFEAKYPFEDTAIYCEDHDVVYYTECTDCVPEDEEDDEEADSYQPWRDYYAGQ